MADIIRQLILILLGYAASALSIASVFLISLLLSEHGQDGTGLQNPADIFLSCFLGRRDGGGEAVVLLSVDQPIPQDIVQKACALEGVKVVTPLAF